MRVGTFTYGDPPSTVTIAVDHDGEERIIALAELTLHLPEHLRAAGDAFTGEGPRSVGSVVYDQDPGNAWLAVFVASREERTHFTLIVTVDGHEMHDYCVTGAESHLSWRTRLPARVAATAPSGAVHEVALADAVSPSTAQTAPSQEVSP
jgi:hypothetical protein